MFRHGENEFVLDEMPGGSKHACSIAMLVTRCTRWRAICERSTRRLEDLSDECTVVQQSAI
jgi:hypothetical protein